MLEFSGFYILFNLQFSRNFCCCLVQQQLLYLTTVAFVCQQLFYFLFYFTSCWSPQRVSMISHSSIHVNYFFNQHFGKKSGERGIWTLAPVSRPTPLAGAPLRPLEYFSEFIFHISASNEHICSSDAYGIILKGSCYVKTYFSTF